MHNFKKFLDHFNFMAGTSGKCEGQYRHNFIVSGLSDDELETLSIVFKYNPSRKYGVGLISKKQYDDETTPVYKASDITVTWGEGVQGFGDLVITSRPKKEESELKYTESWIANLDGDMLDCLSGHLTHDKTYDVIVDENNNYVVLNDKGILKGYHHSWFTPVKLYDEDESELVCRDIEFNKGDWFDLSKHTPEQIRHIAKFYKFYNTEGILEDDCKWTYVYYSSGQFIGTYSERYTTNLEYHFNNLFYLEGE